MKQEFQIMSPNELIVIHRNLKPVIRNRLKEFQQVKTKDYFYELAYCLLTPQSKAEHAEKAIAVLRKNNFERRDINTELLLHQKEFYIRFHKTKAKHLVEMKRQFPNILEQCTNGNTSRELREWLVKNVKGLGWKEASHFLRNIGHRNLAILDRHILKNLVRVGVLKEVPKTLNAKLYLEIEQKFLRFSDEAGISMDELDLTFWSSETGKVLK
ncbi:MAG: N-glycosylase/DNA lyase [Ignavibacteriae bacterium]|nr:N-glycosylase/DNA lyase [Ignavibacteriota bacterium]